MVVNYESYGCVKFRFVKKRKPHALLFLQNSSISQIHKTEIISPTGLILSLADWGCFILEFDVFKSTMGSKLTGLSRFEHGTSLIQHTRLSCFHMFQTWFLYVPNLVIEVTKKVSMFGPGSLAWRLLRTMNIFIMFTDDSFLEVSFLENKEMFLE